MSPRSGPAAPARARRAAGFAAVSSGLALVAHGAAGGALPNAWLLLAGAVPLAGGVYPLLGREATGPRIAAGLAVAQAALHGWLMLAGGHSSHAGDPSGHSTAPRMLAAHAVATVAAVVWLRCAESHVWRRARDAWVRLVLDRQRWMPVPEISAPVPPAAATPDSRSFTTHHMTSCLGMRGPPVPVGP